MSNDILYKKIGRRYIPQSRTFDYESAQPVGTFMLTYAHKDGGKAYEYAVKPDTAGFVAAAMVAQQAMEEAIYKKVQYRPDGKTPYTKKQFAIIEEFRARMMEAGAMLPLMWTSAASWEVAQAGIDAVRDYKP